jgi:hypothetical protein
MGLDWHGSGVTIEIVPRGFQDTVEVVGGQVKESTY